MKIKIIILLILFLPSILLFGQDRRAVASIEQESFDVLLFTKTAAFRHESIEPAVEVLLEQAILHDFNLVHSEDSELFEEDILDSFEVVVFLSTTGDILNDEQQSVFEKYIQAGNGFVGIHAATDTEYEWPWYNGLVGAYFADHPAEHQDATILKIGTHHSTDHLANSFTRYDEWYNFKSLKSHIHPILNLNENSYEGGTMGSYHPISWYQFYDGGRSWYTAGGHNEDSYYEDDFIEHIVRGIFWAAGMDPATVGSKGLK